MSLDTARVRKDFPILQTTMRDRPLVYLDTAASAQKPQPVLDALQDFYAHHYANIHRGVYQLSADATARYEGAREKVRAFIGAAEAREIVFVRNTTEAINLVAASYGGAHVGAGDEVLISALEHHANWVPWQQLCLARGATLRVADVDDAGRLDPARFEALLGERTKLCAITHVSNAIGARLPVRELIRRAHARGVPVLVDGAQAAPRFALDMRELGADFYAFSGHKLYGPSGIGVLYARAELLDAMPPWQTGGGMIERVQLSHTTFAKIPERFEAGTPDIAGAVALGAAVDYLNGLGMQNVERHEAALLARAAELLAAIPGLRIIAGAEGKTGVLSFVLDGIHPHDAGTVLDGEGVAVRAGHHCAQPLMERFRVPATVRASFGVYNDEHDLERLAAALTRCVELFH